MKNEKKIAIKAKEGCPYCGGRCYSTSFIGGLAQVCSCITDQFELRTFDNKITRLEKDENSGNLIQVFEDPKDEQKMPEGTPAEEIIINFQKLIPEINALKVKEKEAVANAICKSFGR